MTHRVLITGVAGLIGSHFSRFLLDQGCFVCGIDNYFGGYPDFVDPRVKMYTVDLGHRSDVEQVFAEVRPDFVYHFAAYAAEGLSPFIRMFNYQNNVLCSANVVNNCLTYNVNKLIFTSSMSVYGVGEPPFRETDTLKPIDPYGIAKYTVEQDIRVANEQFGMRYTIIRPHNIIGIYQNIWDRYRNVIGIWIRRALSGEPILVYGDGEQTRAFSDIKYYMRPMHETMFKGDSCIFNMGADREYKIGDVAKIVQEVAKTRGYEVPIEYKEARHEVKHAYCDHAAAKKYLSLQDQTDIKKTIEEMFDWAKEIPERKVMNMNYEIEKGLYSFWR